MKVRNYLKEEHPYFHSKTKLQWRGLKREINDGATGMDMWNNQHCQVLCTYFTEEETHPATEAEQEAWRKEKSEIARKKRIAEKVKAEQARAMEEERKKQELAKKQWLREIDKSKIICLDVETTGLRAGVDEILQLSIIDGNGNVLFNEYIQPKTKEKWDEAQEIHGISPEMVADKPTIDEHIPVLNKILAEAVLIVGYNSIYFDLKFLRSAGVLIPEDVRNYDVMIEFAPIYGEWDGYFKDYKWQKLCVCAEYYNYESHGTFHDSLEDVRATLHCFYAMIKE